jgi:hypothetical protein
MSILLIISAFAATAVYFAARLLLQIWRHRQAPSGIVGPMVPWRRAAIGFVAAAGAFFCLYITLSGRGPNWLARVTPFYLFVLTDLFILLRVLRWFGRRPDNARSHAIVWIPLLFCAVGTWLVSPWGASMYASMNNRTYPTAAHQGEWVEVRGDNTLPLPKGRYRVTGSSVEAAADGRPLLSIYWEVYNSGTHPLSSDDMQFDCMQRDAAGPLPCIVSLGTRNTHAAKDVLPGAYGGSLVNTVKMNKIADSRSQNDVLKELSVRGLHCYLRYTSMSRPHQGGLTGDLQSMDPATRQKFFTHEEALRQQFFTVHLHPTVQYNAP